MESLGLFLAGLLVFVLLVETATLYYLVFHRSRETPERWPSVSILKPLAGLDDELELNLESHLTLDYPGPWEVLLGVRSPVDAAYPVAKAFAEKHPERVKLVLQEGTPGLNPKVNQLITLTKHATGEVIALTDSNVRVKPQWLREHALYLNRPRVALTSHGFSGVGEATLGSALDNMTLTGFVLPNLAFADVILRMTQIVSKSLAIRRDALQAVGGWEAFKDLLAEDHELGRALAKAGYRTAVCPTPVENVQISLPFSHFWNRHSRWAMIRFKVLPGVWAEPLLNPMVVAGAALLLSGGSARGWAITLALALFAMVNTQVTAIISRGRPFAWSWVALVPVRDVIFFAAWLRGMTLGHVVWRGNRLKVGAKTQLSEG
ncbi:MAG: glycosyltransferase [Archangium sp.]|nr:glycosyltransferase [Archangium sp.]